MSSTSATLPSILPALKDAKDGHRTGRNIVMCLDGTGDQFDGDNSNVVKFFAALKKDDPTQLTYYQSGVGTYSDSYKGALKSGFNAAVDMAIGASLGQHVREAYSFLMQNYRETDKICLIGFSRGAYTARALAGMLHKVGLLPAHNQAQIAFAYSWYKDNTQTGWSMSADFKQTFSIDVDVHFLGCWDTVASVGIIPRILPFAKTNNKAVRYFRHALALDERRAKFKANHWRQRYAKNEREEQHQEHAFDVDGNFLERALEAQHRRAVKLIQDENEHNNVRESPSKTTSSSAARKRNSIFSLFSSQNSEAASTPPPSTVGGVREKRGMSKAEEEFMNMKKFNQTDAKEFGRHFDTDVLEVWFLGCHADCGGGAVANGTRHMVSRIPLRWMIRQSFACETGILFKTDVLAEHGLDLHLLWPTFNPPSAPKFGPSPSTLDMFANSKLPKLDERRKSVRLHVDSLPPSLPPTTMTTTTTTTTTTTNGIKPERNLEWPALWHQLTETWQTSGVLSERDEDYFDCLAEINDQLSQSKSWWILELWPIKYRIKDGEGKWKKQTGPNMGRYRTIRTPSPNVHWTVLQRQELTDYAIRCTLEDGASLNVVY